MEINHDLLRSLGFAEIFNRPDRYVYKWVTGLLHVEAGMFHFQGFCTAISFVTDLKYLLKLIDYQYRAMVEPYPIHDN